MGLFGGAERGEVVLCDAREARLTRRINPPPPPPSNQWQSIPWKMHRPSCCIPVEEARPDGWCGCRGAFLQKVRAAINDAGGGGLSIRPVNQNPKTDQPWHAGMHGCRGSQNRSANQSQLAGGGGGGPAASSCFWVFGFLAVEGGLCRRAPAVWSEPAAFAPMTRGG